MNAGIETDAAILARVSAKSKPPQDMHGYYHQWT
jgi:hypothetical protein